MSNPLVRDITGEALTNRQYEALLHYADGCTHQQAADRMGISDRVFSETLSRVRQKLGARTNAHAVSLAHQQGLLPCKKVHPCPKLSSKKKNIISSPKTVKLANGLTIM